MMWPLSDDTNVILLLCAWLGGEREHPPLTIQEYNLLATRLHRKSSRPRDLMDPSLMRAAAQETQLSPERLAALLERGITLGFYLEEWQRRGYWVCGRADPIYPRRVRQFLKSQAPPVLFGTGEIKLLDRGGMAVMGPHQVMQYSDQQAGMIAQQCAQHDGVTIVAGTQSIAATAAESALRAGGSLVWLLQGPQLGAPLGRVFRRAKASRNLVLLSSRSPSDQRSIATEPEVGRLLMAFCDSAVYVDGTEFSMDQYCLEEAMYGSLGQRNCYICFEAQTTSVGLRLHQCGVQSWEGQATIDTGVFTSLSQTDQGESLPENLVDSPAAAVPSALTSSPPDEQVDEDASTTGAEEDISGAEGQNGRIDFVDIHVEGKQLNLFDPDIDMIDSLSQNTDVILLLYADLESAPACTPLGPEEFSRLRKVLKQQKLEFHALMDASTAQQAARDAQIPHPRLQGLLSSDRRSTLRDSLSRWEDQKIWTWVLGDRSFPEKYQNEGPPVLFGIGDKNILNSKGLAIFGPDSIPERRIHQACRIAVNAAEKGQPILLAGNLRMSKRIMSAVEKQAGQIIWILPHRHQKQQLKLLYYQMIRNHRLVVMTTQSPTVPEESDSPSTVGLLTAGLADEILYVDGSNIKDEKKRTDRFKTTVAAPEHAERCRLLHGQMMSPEGRNLAEKGIELWAEKGESKSGDPGSSMVDSKI